MSMPAGGATAPQHAWPVSRWTSIALGRHKLGDVSTGTPVVEADWGRSRGQFGRERTVGASAFDLTPTGTIVVLDQLNHRLASYRARQRTPTYTPIEFLGGEGDIAIGGDGSVYVLDYGRATEHIPFVRSYSSALERLATTRVAEQATALRVGHRGAIVHVWPSEQWLPVGRGAKLLPPDAQLRGGRPARTFATGEEVAVDIDRRHARFALYKDSDLRGSWSITSATPVGEVQLFEPYRNGLLVVLRLFRAGQAEWQVMQLAPSGLGRRFAVRVVEDIDATALSRFRRHGDQLYVLQSSDESAAIIRYALTRRE